MATQRISTRGATGLTVYLVVLNLADGDVFDWDDDTWQAIGDAVTPAVAMTGLATYGTSQREYAGSIDLALINDGMTPVNVAVKVFSQAGGSPDPETDELLAEVYPFTVVLGERLAGVSTKPAFKVVAVVDTTTTDGTVAHVKVQLLDESGSLIDLDAADPSATCAVNVQRDGVANQFTLSTSDFGAPNGNGWFEADFNNPNFTTDKGYTGIATIVSGGVTYAGACNFNVWP